MSIQQTWENFEQWYEGNITDSAAVTLHSSIEHDDKLEEETLEALRLGRALEQHLRPIRPQLAEPILVSLRNTHERKKLTSEVMNCIPQVQTHKKKNTNWQWALVASVLCAITLFTVSNNKQATVILSQGNHDFTNGDSITSGTIITMKNKQRISFSYARDSLLTISGPAKWSVDNGIRLQHGQLHAEVTEQDLNKPLIITTPDAQATVLGTQFTMDATETGTTLHVTEGSVLFRDFYGGTQVVSEGEAATTQAGKIIYYAHITPEHKQLIGQQLTGEIDIESILSIKSNKPHKLTHADLYKHIYHSHRLTNSSLWKQPHFSLSLSLSLETPFVNITEKTVCHITCRTDGKEQLIVALRQHDLPLHGRFMKTVALPAMHQNKWQTISFPFKEFVRSNLRINKDINRHGPCSHILIHATGNNTQYLDIAKIWFTE